MKQTPGLTLEQYQKYLLKTDKDIIAEYKIAKSKALKEKNYERYIQLKSEENGAFHAMVCLIRASNNVDFVKSAIEYTKG